MAGMLVDSMDSIKCTVAQDDAPESSKAGERRMRLLEAQSRMGLSSSTAAIHPSTSTLVYPTVNEYIMSKQATFGHSSTPLLSPRTPQPLRTPSILPPGKQLSISPSGNWVIIFHPSPTSAILGGTLAIYPSTILLPTSQKAADSLAPLASFVLSSEPVVSIHLYSPRTYVSERHSDREGNTDNKAITRSPPLGPQPPPTFDPAKHVAMVFMTADSRIHLIHSYHIASNTLDSMGQSTSTQTYGLNCLSCSSSSRSFAKFNSTAMGQSIQSVGGDSKGNHTMKRGYLGMVAGSRVVWAGIDEGNGVSRVVAIDCEQHRDGSYQLRTSPLPQIPRVKPPALSAPLSSPAAEMSSTSDITHSTLQAMVFVEAPNAIEQAQVKQEGVENTTGDPDRKGSFQDRGGVVLVFQDTCNSIGDRSQTITRTRFELFTLEKRTIELAEGFKEIDSTQNEGERLMSDWSVSSGPTNTVLSPPNVIISALLPLPAVPPHSLVLAVISAPQMEPALCHVNLAAKPSEAEDSDEENWSAVLGPKIPLPDRVGADADLVVSQGVERGSLGLVGFVGNGRHVDLLITPGLHNVYPPQSRERVTQEAALSTALAIKQGVGWGDVLRASFGCFLFAEWPEFGKELLRTSYVVLSEHGLVDLRSFLRVQVAVHRITQDHRISLSSELLRLLEVSLILDRCSFGLESEADLSIKFDTSAIWGLISIVDWTLLTLVESIRDGVQESCRLEWDDGLDDGTESLNPKSIYLLHPSLRRLLIKLLAQLQAFSSFMTNLETPIALPHEALTGVDPQAAEFARLRVESIFDEYGLDLAMWKSALERISDDGLTPDQIQESLLSVRLADMRDWANTILPTLPSPSSIFSADLEAKQSTLYDAITFEPLIVSTKSVESGPVSRVAKGLVTCDRCGWRTSRTGLSNVSIPGPLGEWRVQWSLACLCGGTWTI